MKIVGITSYYDEEQQCLNQAYLDAFRRNEFVPVIIPCFSSDNRESLSLNGMSEYFEYAKTIAEKIDILVLSGGADINPLIFGQENYASHNTNIIRDKVEFALAKTFMQAKKPIMGICRGFQLLGQVLKLDHFQQDLTETREVHSGSELEIEIRNEPVHEVTVYGEFLDFLNKNKVSHDGKINVNSWHHQGFTIKDNMRAIKEEQFSNISEKILCEKRIKILARTPCVIEAFEHSELPIFGVQWHPEEYGNKGLTIDYFLRNYGG